jgi:hypothetical protein
LPAAICGEGPAEEKPPLPLIRPAHPTGRARVDKTAPFKLPVDTSILLGGPNDA